MNTCECGAEGGGGHKEKNTPLVSHFACKYYNHRISEYAHFAIRKLLEKMKKLHYANG